MSSARLIQIPSLLPLFFCTVFTGCAGINSVPVFLQSKEIRQDQRREIRDIRKENAEQLAEERIEALRIQAERENELLRAQLQQQQLEAEFCLANQMAQQDLLRSQLRDKLQSKVAFNVEQGLEVGELEVDIEKLEELLEARKKEESTAPRAQFSSPTCGCSNKMCGCRPGLLRRNCRTCCTKACDCPQEQTCGGPETLREALTNPVRQPLRPQEIPLKLPVTLTFGMQNPEIEEARIRRESLVTAPDPTCPPTCDSQCTSPSCRVNGCTCTDASSTSLIRQNGGSAIPIPPRPIVERNLGDQRSTAEPASTTTTRRAGRARISDN